MGANQQRGSSERNHFDRFDELPMVFKRLLWFAPENYKVGWVYQLIARLDEQTALTEVRYRISALTQETIAKYWPSGHPQARR